MVYSIKGGVNESLTKIPLKTEIISQKSSFFRGGQSDFCPILDLAGVNIVTFSRGVHLAGSNFRRGVFDIQKIFNLKFPCQTKILIAELGK